MGAEGREEEVKNDLTQPLSQIPGYAADVASALLYYVGDSVPAFRVKLGATDLSCVGVLLNPILTHSLTQ